MQSILAFAIKVGIFFVGVFIFFYVSIATLKDEFEANFNIKGGSEFWTQVEKKLYKIADEKDLPEEKKARIIDALRKIGKKYGPYVDALNSRS